MVWYQDAMPLPTPDPQIRPFPFCSLGVAPLRKEEATSQVVDISKEEEEGKEGVDPTDM